MRLGWPTATWAESKLFFLFGFRLGVYFGVRVVLALYGVRVYFGPLIFYIVLNGFEVGVCFSVRGPVLIFNWGAQDLFFCLVGVRVHFPDVEA